MCRGGITDTGQTEPVSRTLAAASHPSEIRWRTLPEGEEGIHNWPAMRPGNSEEGHVVPVPPNATGGGYAWEAPGPFFPVSLRLGNATSLFPQCPW